MKRLLISFNILFVVIVSSCNIDTSPSEEEILNGLDNRLIECELNFTNFYAGEYAVYSNILSQQLAGISNQMLAIDRYDITEVTVNDMWGNFYLGVLRNLKILGDESAKNGYIKYEAISKLLMAHTLALGTDVWGDLPINNFISKELELTPTFQTQETVYNTIFQLINESITGFENSVNHNFPSNADLFYKGNTDKWMRFANFLKLKYSLRLTQRNGWETMLEHADGNILNGLSDSVSLSYFTIDYPQNPLFKFNSKFPNQIQAGEYIISKMISQSDPRLPIFFESSSSSSFIGIPPGSGFNNGCIISKRFCSELSTVKIATFSEQCFILAEVFFRNNKFQEAISAYNDGLLASIKEHGITSNEWFNSNKLSESITLNDIIEAKYIALFMNPEAWVDWRRTGIPHLTPATLNYTNNNFPRRFPYPSNEYNLNPNVPPSVPIWTPLWWNQN